jgi:nitrogen fixation NifU-like protein
MDRLDRLVSELQNEIDEKERAIYSARVLEQARNPTNLGRLEPADAHASYTGWCGDTMEVWIHLQGGAIRQASFMTDGCGPAVACGNMVTTLVVGMTPDEANQVQPQDVIRALDGLPEESAHCAELAVTTLRRALAGLQPRDAAAAQ